MASGYKVNGVDLDDWFEPYSSGTKGGNTGYEDGGVDLKDIYQPIASGLQGPPTGVYYASEGSYSNTDLSDIFGANVSNYVIASKISSTRTTSWTNQLIHQVQIVFASASAADTFFEYSGQIRFAASRSGGSNNDQNTSMTNLLNSVGTVQMQADNTIRSGSAGSNTSIGYNQLTGSWQTIFDASGSGIYSGDRYRVQAYQVSTTQIVMRAVFNDASDLNPSWDEAIDGTLVSTVSERRHEDLSSPTYTNLTLLTAGS